MEAFGNLTMRDIGAASIEKIHGELSARDIKRELHLGTADGNVTVRQIEGPFVVGDTVRGNLSLSEAKGSSHGSASGNISLKLAPATGQSFAFAARGNLVCRLPRDSNVKVKASTRGRLLFNVGEVNKAGSDQEIEIVLNKGEASLTLEADGNLVITEQAADFDVGEDFDIGFDKDFGEGFEINVEEVSRQVAQQIEAQLEMIERQLNTQMESLNSTIGIAGLSAEQAERINRQARDATAKAAARAQEKMARAREKLQRKIEAAKRKAEQQARSSERRAQYRERRSWGFEWPSTPSTPAATESAEEAVSDEERLTILRMLEQKKITPEEAEQLLTALEGKG
jgi:hypothetical protein